MCFDNEYFIHKPSSPNLQQSGKGQEWDLQLLEVRDVFSYPLGTSFANFQQKSVLHIDALYICSVVLMIYTRNVTILPLRLKGFSEFVAIGCLYQ